MKGKIRQRLVTTILMMVVSVGCIFAQSNMKVNKTEADTLYIVDENPTFPGGDSALMDFLRKNLKYPKKAVKKKIEGRVLISFNVEKDGSITNVKKLNDVHPLLYKEALRIVKMMPKWTPGKHEGKVVRVRFTLPVTFKIPKDDLKY